MPPANCHRATFTVAADQTIAFAMGYNPSYEIPPPPLTPSARLRTRKRLGKNGLRHPLRLHLRRGPRIDAEDPKSSANLLTSTVCFASHQLSPNCAWLWIGMVTVQLITAMVGIFAQPSTAC